jgi:coenzyme F420-reducing hydrogenase delta subunit
MNTYEHVEQLRDILEHSGISKERLQQYFCSAAEVEKFMNAVKDITQKVHNLPPLPKKKTEIG